MVVQLHTPHLVIGQPHQGVGVQLAVDHPPAVFRGPLPFRLDESVCGGRRIGFATQIDHGAQFRLGVGDPLPRTVRPVDETQSHGVGFGDRAPNRGVQQADIDGLRARDLQHLADQVAQ
ncbi:hypothetical protein GCM10023319_32060 [Nocardia iowensis]